MAASVSDALLREAATHHKRDTNGIDDGQTITTTTTTISMTILPCGPLPSGMGGYSASRRGSEEHAPRDLMQVRPAPFFSLRTATSERSCPLQENLACDLRSKKSSVGIVFNSALVKRRRCHKVADNHGGPTNSGSALGAVLGDDDCVHTCRGSDEAGINLTVERHQLQSVFNKPSSKCNKDAVRVLSTPSSPSFEVHDGTPPITLLLCLT